MTEQNVREVSELNSSHQRLEHSISQVNVTMQEFHSSSPNEAEKHFKEVYEKQEQIMALVTSVGKEREETDGRQMERDMQLEQLIQTMVTKIEIERLFKVLDDLKAAICKVNEDVETRFNSLVITKKTETITQMQNGELRKGVIK